MRQIQSVVAVVAIVVGGLAGIAGLSACNTSAHTSPPEQRKPATGAVNKATNGSAPELRAGEKAVRLQIEGMRCGGCVARAQEVLRSFDEVRTASVDLESGMATVIARTEADPTTWIRALTDGDGSGGKSMSWTVRVVDGSATPSTAMATNAAASSEGCCGMCGGGGSCCGTCNSESAATDSEALTAGPGEELVQLRIDGMRCNGCASRARTILQGFDEIRAASVDLESGVATVVARENANPAPWLRAVSESRRSDGSAARWVATLVE